MDEYTKKIIYYMNNQSFNKKLENYSHKLSLKSSDCGDWNDVYILIKDNVIIDISYENSGCSLNIAVLEIFCEYLIDKDISEVKKLNPVMIEERLKFPKSKLNCINLAIDNFTQLNN